jgi:Ca-activated chloride channel family protein
MSLVKGLAAQSGGMAEFVSPDEHMEEKVLRQFSRFDAPCIQDITINWNGAKIKQAPADPPPLFSGDSFTLYGLIEAGTPAEQVELTGMCGGSEIRLSAPVTEMPAGNLIPLLWAKHAIRDLETGADAGSRQAKRKAESRKKKIIALAKRYQLLSSETSFVAVETRAGSEKAHEAPAFRRVPVGLTRGWHGIQAASIDRETFFSNIDFCSCLANEEHSMRKEEAGFVAECSACMSDVSDSEINFGSERLSPSSPMYELLLAQTPEGWFEPTEVLCSYADTTMDDLKKISSRIGGVESEHMRLLVLSTALTIIVLQEKEAERNDMWDRAAKKAAAVLHSRAPDAVLDGKPVIDQVKELFFS